ncbi:hypothetical protein ACUH97_08065 [Dermabacteraceae bacterium P13088]
MKQDQYATNAEGQFFRVSWKSDTRPLNGRLNLSEGYTPEASGGRVQESSMAVAPDLFTACAVEFLRSEGYVVMPPVEGEGLTPGKWLEQANDYDDWSRQWAEQSKRDPGQRCYSKWAQMYRDLAAFCRERAESLRAKKEAGQ